MDWQAVHEACREWMRGCSCATDGKPWECEPCTDGFRSRLLNLLGDEPISYTITEAGKAALRGGE